MLARHVVGIVAGWLVWAALVLPEPPVAQGQGDWSITREPRGSSARERQRARQPRRQSGRRARQPREAQQPAADRTEALIARYMRILESDPRETFAFRRLLDLYRERDGNIDRLVQELAARVTEDDSAYAPRMLLGHIYRAQSRLEEARTMYRESAELRPRDPAPLVALARLEESARRPLEARRFFEQALALTRERLAREELLREVAQVVMELRDFDAARGYYEELARRPGGSVFLRTEYARALGAAREWERAIVEYQRVIRSLAGDNRVLPPVLLELSRAQLESGALEASIETLDRALRAAGGQSGIRAEIYEQMLVAHRRTDRLPELADRLRREAGRAFEPNALLGRIEDELGNDEGALAAYRRALRARGNDIDTRVRIIQILSRSGRLDDVVTEYRTLIRSAPREPRFVIELAQLLMQTDRRDEALRLVREAGRRRPRDPALHQQLAELYARWGEEELAAREIELLVRIDPHDPAHVIALGAQQYAAGDREAAMVTWRRVLSAENDRARGHATLGGILADHDLLPQAIEQYREAVRLEGDAIAYVRGLATVLERNRNEDQAEAQWRRVLELARDDRPARREARERIVGIWIRTRQLPARVRELERRFAAGPDAEAGRFLAECHRRSGAARQADAERVLERVIQIEPGDVESLLALERLRTHRGDLAGAIEVLQRLRDADPRRAARYLSRMAEHALALYRDEEAVEYAAEAVRHNPDDASGHRRLGDLYRARQDTDAAIQRYRRALELNDRLYPVYFELAELHLARGDVREGDQLYRQVLRIAPDDDLVARAARASIQINLGAGTLADLERELLPLALGHPQRPIFRRMAVELYDAYVGFLRTTARRGEAAGAEARAELRQIGARAIKPLLEALADQDPSQRRVALDILGELGNPNAAAPLLALAETDALELGQRMQALLAAGSVAEPALVPRFRELASSGDRQLRALATWSIAWIGGREAPGALRRLLGSSEPAVRAFAAIGLGMEGSSSDAATLARALSDEATEDVRMALVWALGRVGDADHVPALVRVLEVSGGGAAAVAADALGEVANEAAVAALIRALFEPDPVVRSAAASALRRASRDSERVAVPILDTFESPRSYLLRVVAARASTASVQDLAAWRSALQSAAEQALGGPVEQVLAALEVLSSARVGVGLGPLTEGMSTWPVEARESAERALSGLSEALIDELVAAAEHLDAAVRVEAVRLLVKMNDPRADAAVAAALEGPPASVQRAALDALAASERTLGAPIAERLAAILRGNRDWSMRTRAARALGTARGEPARESLRQALRADAYAFVREAAASSLAREPQRRDVAALEAASAHDGEPRVRLAALVGLVALGGEVAERARARAAVDSSELLRAAVD